MLAGDPPHTGSTVQAIIARLVTERPTPLRVLRQTVPVGIEEAVAKALAKLPADRYASAGAFARAMASGSEGHRPERARSISRRITIGALGIAVAVAIGVGVAKFGLGRDRRVPANLSGRAQLTTSGRVAALAISGDGNQLAFATREFTRGGYRYALELQNVGSNATRRLLDAWEGIAYVIWSPDRRNLVVYGTSDSRSGYFLVSTAGAPPRFLGSANVGFTAGGDSLLFTSAPDSTGRAWIRATALDGTAGDSIPLADLQLGDDVIAFAVPGSSWRLLVVASGPSAAIRLIDRQGRVSQDRILLRPINEVRVSADAIWVRLLGPSMLLRIPFDAGSGRMSASPDTVYSAGICCFDVTADGSTVVLGEGSTDRDVWALEFSSLLRGDFKPEKRLLRISTGMEPTSRLTEAGSWCNGYSRCRQRAARCRSFHSREASRHPCPSRGKLQGGGWVDSLTVKLVEEEAGKLRSVLVDVRTGERRDEVKTTGSAMTNYAVLSNGTFVWFPEDRHSIRVARPGDVAPRVFPMPAWYARLEDVNALRGDLDVGFFGTNASGDSLRFSVLSLTEGKAVPWATMLGEYAYFFGLRDGSVLLAVMHPEDVFTLYRLRGPGQIERMGTIPHSVRMISVSEDMKRATVMVREYHFDAFSWRVVRP